jgi:hypothetical protein
MGEAERQAVLDVLRRQGFRPSVGGARRRLDGRFAKKLQALWIGAWNLGLVRNPDDRALLAFVRRQTGIDHVRFLHYATDAARAIEALKGWMAREAEVEWSVEKDAPDFTQQPGCRIAKAQFAILKGVMRRSPSSTRWGIGSAVPSVAEWLPFRT